MGSHARSFRHRQHNRDIRHRTMRRRDLIERGRIQARGGPTAAANAAPAPAPPPAAVAAPHSAKRRKTPTAAKKNASFGSPSAVRSPLAAINLNDSRFKGPTAGRAGSGSPRVRSNLSKSSFGSPVVVAPPSAGPTRTTNIIAPAPSPSLGSGWPGGAGAGGCSFASSAVAPALDPPPFIIPGAPCGGI